APDRQRRKRGQRQHEHAWVSRELRRIETGGPASKVAKVALSGEFPDELQVRPRPRPIEQHEGRGEGERDGCHADRGSPPRESLEGRSRWEAGHSCPHERYEEKRARVLGRGRETHQGGSRQ